MVRRRQLPRGDVRVRAGHQRYWPVEGLDRAPSTSSDASAASKAITVDGQDIVRHGSRSGIPPANAPGCIGPRQRMHHRRLQLGRTGWRFIEHRPEVQKGGDNTPENLTTLCWWHHHVAIHRQGMQIDPQSPPRRRRLLPTPTSCGHQPPEPDPHTLAILRALHAATNRAPP